jgi:hypothetical protein
MDTEEGYGHQDGATTWQYGGMTLRDYFAAKAMPAIYDVAMREAEQGSGLLADDQWRVGLAFDAYKMADAMLKAREAE